MELKLACSCQVPSRAVFGRCSISASLWKQDFPSDVFYEHVKMPRVPYAFLISKTFRICTLSPLNTKYFDWKKKKNTPYLLLQSTLWQKWWLPFWFCVCRDLEAQGVLWPLVFKGCHAVSFLSGLQNNCSVVMDGMCVSPFKCVCWRASPHCDSIWRWSYGEVIRWGHDDGALMMGLVSLFEETPKSLVGMGTIEL